MILKKYSLIETLVGKRSGYIMDFMVDASDDKKKITKIGLISSAGGHLYKLSRLKPWWGNYQRFWVTDDKTIRMGLLKGERVFYGNFPENRNLINFGKNLLLASKILRREKPDLIFSMGAGIAPPFVLVAKMLKIKVVFMETFVYIPKPTLSGKLIYPLADYFLVQNPKLLQFYKRAKYWGSVW